MSSDTNFHSISSQSGSIIDGDKFAPDDPTAWDDVFKVSNSKDIRVRNCYIRGGRENAVDVNNLSSVEFTNCHFRWGEQAGVVVKGGSEAGFRLCRITPSGSPQDFLIDDWSDQSQKPSTVRIVDCYRSDGEAIRVVFGRWRRPEVLRSHVKILWWRTIGLHIYNIAKGMYVQACKIKNRR